MQKTFSHEFHGFSRIEKISEISDIVPEG